MKIDPANCPHCGAPIIGYRRDVKPDAWGSVMEAASGAQFHAISTVEVHLQPCDHQYDGELRVEYTDEELADFRRWECRRKGHSWQVIELATGVPIRVLCRHCGESHAIEAPTS